MQRHGVIIMNNLESQDSTNDINKAVSEEDGLKYLWSSIATFTVIYILHLWILDRTNKLLIDIFHFDDTWESAPVFALTFGTFITILTFVLMLSLIRNNKNNNWLERIPPLWVDIDIKSQLGRVWRCVIVAFVLLFPLFAQVHFWRRLHNWQVWKNNTQAEIVGLWSFVSPQHFISWNAYRYGDHSKRLTEDGFGGVSFLPFWQPIIMLVFTFFLLVLTIKIVLALSRRVSI